MRTHIHGVMYVTLRPSLRSEGKRSWVPTVERPTGGPLNATDLQKQHSSAKLGVRIRK